MLKSAELLAGPWRVVFQQRDDRVAHEIWYQDATAIRLLASQETAASELWPRSPPLQQLHVEQRPDGMVALLVGMAGRNHWSLSCTADSGRGQLHFDVACRLRWSPDWLGSSYRLLSSKVKVTAEPGCLLFSTETAFARLISPLPIAVGNGEIAVPAPAAREGYPQTVRWQYLFQ